MPAEMNEGGVDIPEVTELSMLDKGMICWPFYQILH